MAGLESLFSPRGVAIVGASARGGLFGRPLKFLNELGYKGGVYPINPRYDELEGIPCYPSLEAVPADVDLALLMVPAPAALDVIDTCGRLGISFAAVLASGFAETGAEGRALQQELVATAAGAGVHVLGPNCQGLIYQPSLLAATFTAGIDHGFSESSGIAYVGQSGAVGGSVLDRAHERGSDLTAWVSTGNQADLDLFELADHLLDDPSVAVCMCYLEELLTGSRFIDLANHANEMGKHLVVLRSGRTAPGQRAVSSHTGALLGADPGFDLVARRHGVTVVNDIDEMIDAAIALRFARPPGGRGVGIVTSSGGAGSLLADHLDALALTVPQLTSATQATVTELVPAFGSSANPVDITAQLTGQLSIGDSSAFDLVCRSVANDPAVELLAVVLTMPSGDAARRLASDLSNVTRDISIPLLVAWIAGDERTREGRAMLREAEVPVFSSVSALARAARVLVDRTEALEAPLSAEEPQRDLPPGAKVALAAAAASGVAEVGVLDALGIPSPRSHLAATPADAHRFARQLGRPVALKVVVPGELHKSDAGGVVLDLQPEDVGDAFESLLRIGRSLRPGDAEPPGVLVQQMAQPGVELLVSARTSRLGYPPVVTVGLGGVATELYNDVVAMPVPFTRAAALETLHSLRCWPLLDGYRGRPIADVAALLEVLMSLASIAVACGDTFDVLEMNPIIVGPVGTGATAVDLVVTPPTAT